MKKLDGYRVAVLATDGFEESELVEPCNALRDAGAQVSIVAPHDGQIQGFHHDTKSNKVRVDRALHEVQPEDFDAAYLPGGALNADSLRMNADARKFLQAMQSAGKPIACICHGAWTLVSAGLVSGRNLTSYYTIQDDIRNAGGNWSDQPVVVDRNWVTSRQPSDLPAFNQAIIELFARSRKPGKVEVV